MYKVSTVQLYVSALNNRLMNIFWWKLVLRVIFQNFVASSSSQTMQETPVPWGMQIECKRQRTKSDIRVLITFSWSQSYELQCRTSLLTSLMIPVYLIPSLFWMQLTKTAEVIFHPAWHKIIWEERKKRDLQETSHLTIQGYPTISIM